MQPGQRPSPNQVDAPPGEGDGTHLTLPKKSPFQVYVAKYSYDPDQFSPNENPEAELVLNAGDYVFVYGDMDEDGFFEAELMDGRRGLVPSNFVEAVPEEDLEDFHAALAGGATQDDSSNTGSLPQELDFNSSDESERLADLSEDPTKVKQKSVDVLSDLEDIEECEEEADRTGSMTTLDTDVYKGIPCPTRLTLERQLTNSVLVGWAPPVDLRPTDMEAYHVFVDGHFRTSVRATERTKALLESVSSTQTHRISVRTVTARGQSLDSECTILIGKDVDLSVTELKMSKVTPTSATVMWLPADSNLEHVVAVNGIDTRTARPGASRMQLTGLAASSRQRVSVRPKLQQPPYANTLHLARSLEFVTPAAGTPDAPLDVQVESGPQQGSLLVTWLPVTITTAGTSNGAKVLGYAVFADGTCLKELLSPTGDHAVLHSGDLERVPHPHNLTVRTLAEGKQSVDSNMAPLLPHILAEMSATNDQVPPQGYGPPVHQHSLPEGSWSPHPQPPPCVQQQQKQSPRHRPRLKHSGGSGEPDGMETGFSPISDDLVGEHERGGPAGRTPPRGAESPPKLVRPAPPPTNNSMMTVPHIEITKDSSGSISTSGAENFSDEDGESVLSSTSGISSKPSPVTPDRHFCDIDGHPQPQPPPHHPHHHLRQLPPGRQQPSLRQQQSQSRDDPNAFPPPSPGVGVENKPRHQLTGGKSLEGPGGAPNANTPPRTSPGGMGTRSKRRDYFDDQDDQFDPSLAGGPRSPQFNTGDSFDETRPHRHPHQPHHGAGMVGGPRKILDDIPDSELIDYEDDGEGESLVDDLEADYNDGQVRVFLALFDYDPVAMSPNPDAADEELPFKEGQLIKIYGEKDPDGFYMGEANGRQGLVPGNMVSEVPVDDPSVAAQLLTQSGGRGPAGAAGPVPAPPLSPGFDPDPRRPPASQRRFNGTASRHTAHKQRPLSRNGFGHFVPDGPVTRMVALYDYDPQELSPNVDVDLELPIRTGDMITVYGEMDDDGFFYGELNGKYGLVPSNFLQEAPLAYDEYGRQLSPRSPRPGVELGSDHPGPGSGGDPRRPLSPGGHDPRGRGPPRDYPPPVPPGDGSRRRPSPHRRTSPHRGRRSSPHGGGRRGMSSGGGEPDIHDEDHYRDYHSMRGDHDRDHSRERSRDRDRDRERSRDRGRDRDRADRDHMDRDHMLDRDRDRDHIDRDHLDSSRDRDYHGDRDRDYHGDRDRGHSHRGDRGDHPHGDHPRDHSDSRRPSARHHDDLDSSPHHGGGGSERPSRRDHHDRKRHDRGSDGSRSTSDHTRGEDSQSKRTDHAHSADGDGAANKHSPAKSGTTNVGSSEPKTKPKPLLKADPSTSLEQDSVIEPEIDPEQDPLSPQRMITFDDTTSSKKKKGFFSKGKNIFKKLSR